MGILDRMATLVKANLNDVVSKAEDPEKILNQALVDMERDLKKAKVQIVESLATQKQAEKKLARLREDAHGWESKAMAALKAEEEDLARKALAEKQKIDQDIHAYDDSVKTQAEYVGALKSSLAMLETKIKEAKGKRDELLQRLATARRAQKQTEASAAAVAPRDALQETSAFDNFDRMAGKIEMLESQVEAQRELLGPEIEGAQAESELRELSLDEQLKALKQRQANPVEDELAALKRKLQES